MINFERASFGGYHGGCRCAGVHCSGGVVESSWGAWLFGHEVTLRGAPPKIRVLTSRIVAIFHLNSTSISDSKPVSIILLPKSLESKEGAISQAPIEKLSRQSPNEAVSRPPDLPDNSRSLTTPRKNDLEFHRHTQHTHVYQEHLEQERRPGYYGRTSLSLASISAPPSTSAIYVALQLHYNLTTRQSPAIIMSE